MPSQLLMQMTKFQGTWALILICHWVAYRLTLTSISTFQLLNHLSFLLDLVQVFTHVGTAIHFFIKRPICIITIKCLHREGQPAYSTPKACLMVEHPSVNHLFFVPNPAVTPVTGVHGVRVGLSLVLKLVQGSSLIAEGVFVRTVIATNLLYLNI